MSMIDMRFWQEVADKWTTVLDFDLISRIKKDAETTARDTIGTGNENLLNPMSIFDEYGEE